MAAEKPIKVGDRVIGAGDVTLRVDSMLLEKVEAMERAR
jgi:hypothetical protein